MKILSGFILDFNPPTVTHQEKRWTVRNGKPVSYEDSRLADAREKLTAYLNQAKPEKPFTGPLFLSVVWMFQRDRDTPEWKLTKPDTDNLNKLLKDCMTQTGFWIDDAQVCHEQISKLWTDTPGIIITIGQLFPKDIPAEILS